MRRTSRLGGALLALSIASALGCVTTSFTASKNVPDGASTITFTAIRLLE